MNVFVESYIQKQQEGTVLYRNNVNNKKNKTSEPETLFVGSKTRTFIKNFTLKKALQS